MNILKNPRVQEYIKSLNGMNPSQYKLSVCRCLQKNLPEDAHVKVAQPFSNNLAELAASQEPVRTIRSIVMYITMTSYFDGDTMKYLIDRMLKSEDVQYVHMCYNVLMTNFEMHPPCAKYMWPEYEKLMLIPYRNCFEEMSVWDYLIGYLNRMISGLYLYGDNEVFDLAFKKLFCFCVDILNVDFDVSKKYNFKALIMKCLKFNPDRKTRMYEFTTLLDKLFNTGYNIELPVINLALLINKFR